MFTTYLFTFRVKLLKAVNGRTFHKPRSSRSNQQIQQPPYHTITLSEDPAKMSPLRDTTSDAVSPSKLYSPDLVVIIRH